MVSSEAPEAIVCVGINATVKPRNPSSLGFLPRAPSKHGGAQARDGELSATRLLHPLPGKGPGFRVQGLG